MDDTDLRVIYLLAVSSGPWDCPQPQHHLSSIVIVSLLTFFTFSVDGGASAEGC